jgi:YegS/Rv2252/BmrU family lipid kinase
MPHVLFVLNPRAGRAAAEELEAAISQVALRSRAISSEILVPESPEQLRILLRQKSAQNEIDILAIVGGDGSVMEVLPVLVEYPQILLGLIPRGTGNLLAANLGIPTDLSSALQVLYEGAAKKIDVGRIGSSYFALLAGVGTAADIMENTESRHKKWLGMWAYLVHGVRTILQANQSLFRVTFHGHTVQVRGVSVIISNAASLMPPCPALTPEAKPDDGLLDICVLKAHSKRDYVPVVLEAMQHSRLSPPARKVLSFQTRKLRIESSPPLKVQADGNIIGTTPVDIEIVREAIQILLPRKTESTTGSKNSEEKGSPNTL